MSATISVEKQVGVVTTKEGVCYYALFESAIDSDTDSTIKDALWGCFYFGTREACMQKIITWARAAEDGAIKDIKGRLTPSAYIKRWREAFAKPFSLQVTEVHAKMGNGTYCIGEQHRSTVADILHVHGIEISDDTVSLDLLEHAATLQQILDECRIVAQKFIQIPDFHFDARRLEVAESDYIVPKAPAASLQGELFKIQCDGRFGNEFYYLSRSPEGVTSLIGLDCSAVQHLITEVVAPGEQASPGSAENTIRAIRKALKEAKPLPLEQVTIVYRDDHLSIWEIENFKRYASKMGRGAESLAVIATIKEILAADAFYSFQSCNHNAIAFPQLAALPEKNERKAHAPASVLAENPGRQPALHRQSSLADEDLTPTMQNEEAPPARRTLRRIRPALI